MTLDLPYICLRPFSLILSGAPSRSPGLPFTHPGPPLVSPGLPLVHPGLPLVPLGPPQILICGESGGTSRFNEREALSRRDLVAERERAASES